LLVELQSARLCAELAPTVEIVTYRKRETSHLFLNDLLQQEGTPGQALWIVSWGFDVPGLLRQLRGRPVAYHAHSSGYGFDLPPGVPVLAVSRNTLGYWGDRAPRAPLQLVPNALDPAFDQPPPAFERGQRRPLDVLVQARKTSGYVLNQLVPALQAQGLKVEVQSGWVEDLAALFRTATVMLYDSADYWRGVGLTEGFGLPPLEALASGCVLFSSFNHALADGLDPDCIGMQIGCGSLINDLERISAAVANPDRFQPDPQRLNALLATHSEENVQKRWQQALAAINRHWDRMQAGAAPLKSVPSWQLRWGRRWSRLKRLF
jgi:hypothetical protein